MFSSYQRDNVTTWGGIAIREVSFPFPPLSSRSYSVMDPDSLLELVERSRSEGIRADETCPKPPPLIMHRELRTRRRLSGALQIHRISDRPLRHAGWIFSLPRYHGIVSLPCGNTT
jgi:hypothetical protein